QYRIIKMLGSRYGNVCVVGDPDQTIYSWRQAEIRNTDNFRKDFPGARVIGMAENYRSTHTIVDAANTLIRFNSKRKEKALTTSRTKGEKIRAVRLADEEAEALFIARTIKALSAAKKLKHSEIAVLYRINAQSRALEDQLNRESVPYRLAGGTPFYKRREIMDIAAWLRVMRNPDDDAALLRVIRIAGKGLGDRSVAVIQEQAVKTGSHLYQSLERAAAGLTSSLPVRAQRVASRFLTALQELRVQSRHSSLPSLMNRILEKTAYQDHLKGESSPDERWENVVELVSMAAAYKNLSPPDALTALLDRISNAAEAADRQQEEDSVTLNTLHGSKGMEFPAVFICGVEEGLLPHSRSLDDPEKLEEERRLCYVGITRAMDIVHLTYTEKRRTYSGDSFRVPSRFLRELPMQLLLHIDLAGLRIDQTS
ncbi:MAG: UvrD-helicase domain-containing protein, partial [Dehalococcoidia bacterium]|nr:UvrD-helicase domain-containing protein [Dehalococcoidia bacterium]